METTIILHDSDEHNVALGVLIVKNHTIDDVYKSFSKTRKKDGWTVEDLIQGLVDSGFDIKWNNLVSSIFI